MKLTLRGKIFFEVFHFRDPPYLIPECAIVSITLDCEIMNTIILGKVIISDAAEFAPVLASPPWRVDMKNANVLSCSS